MTSLWMKDAETPARLRLTPGSHFDTVVIGAGITGLVTALLLAESGVEVAVVEGRRIGESTTGASTGKVSLLQGTRAQRIRRRHGDRALINYVEANQAGRQWLLRYCAEHSLPVQRESAVTYAQSEREKSAVRKELEALQAARLPVESMAEADVPFPFFGAVTLSDQAQLDPIALLAALAADVEAHTAPIFESTLAHNVHNGGNGELRVETEHGELTARTVVIATGTPFLDRGGYFARLVPRRSYLSAFRVAEPIPRQMFLSAGGPTRSVRYAPTPEGDVLMVGGHGHVVGRACSALNHADELIEWTRRWFPSAEPLHNWSAQDYLPIDELPYVGPLLPGRDQILVATGYAKWGLTNGVAAALALAGRVTGKPPVWASSLSSWRTSELRSLPTAVSANISVAHQLLTGWRHALGSGRGTLPPEGQGRIERHGVIPTAVSTVNGVTTEISAVCPHLGGILGWNDAEQSWDCPLHGSRFAPDGTLLDGPASTCLHPMASPYRTPDRFPGPEL
ncbi:FAD-dependent oxidoreductase [Nocardia sp. NBC_01503]|uniref:FAD-dependent oxidoreductase n=1 Tax=Nocardia sp. NBC_01503 TaxID=2975997 RepID=UPI002E7B71FF|nr:FAD-dependent oxidoreductase [Nocardia sp. NBC_01503]WTL30869.1 FAD-dependent oxidoreductase [Nocardia sp. NBC_01503]